MKLRSLQLFLAVYCLGACAKQVVEERAPTARPILPPIHQETDQRIQSVPVETFLRNSQDLQAGTIFKRSIKLAFFSNYSNATFECSMNNWESFTACSAGDSSTLTLSQLKHEEVYVIHVRARTPNGLIDASPLKISFIVNLTQQRVVYNGDIFQKRLGRINSVGDLPAPHYQPTPDKETPRVLLGEQFIVLVPEQFIVHSYTSTKNLVNDLISYRLSPDDQCGVQERLVTHPSSLKYCESFPHLNQIDDLPWFQYPLNHVALAREAGDIETLFATVSTSDTDTRHIPEYEHLCANATSSYGVTPPVFPNLQQISHEDSLRWCLTTSDNAAVWTGFYTLNIQKASGETTRLVAVYSLTPTATGMLTPEAFVAKMNSTLSGLLIPELLSESSTTGSEG